MSVDEERERAEIARACRALALAGVLEGVLGHISVRRDDGVLVRCRGPEEHGLRFTRTDDVRRVDHAGNVVDAQGYAAPNELPIHTSVLAVRRDLHAVVHAHPPAALIAGLAGLELQPIFGAYDIPAARLAETGIPVYPRSVLIDTRELGADVAAAMGDANVCLLRGHGIVAAGASLQQAVVAAVQLETLARVAVALRRVGAEARPIAEADLAQLPDLGSGFNDGNTYRHLVARLEVEDRLWGMDVDDRVEVDGGPARGAAG